jgi:hypothetical protein
MGGFHQVCSKMPEVEAAVDIDDVSGGKREMAGENG